MLVIVLGLEYSREGDLKGLCIFYKYVSVCVFWYFFSYWGKINKVILDNKCKDIKIGIRWCFWLR